MEGGEGDWKREFSRLSLVPPYCVDISFLQINCASVINARSVIVIFVRFHFKRRM